MDSSPEVERILEVVLCADETVDRLGSDRRTHLIHTAYLRQKGGR